MKSAPALKKAILFTTVMAFVAITFGAFVRVTGSGLGCPDWPLCHGRIVPPFDDIPAWIEWMHRYAVLFLTLGMVYTLVSGFRLGGIPKGMLIAPIVLLVIQITLGALTVKTEISPPVAGVHFMVAMLFLASIIMLLVYCRAPLPSQPGPALGIMSLFFTTLVLLTILIGVIVMRSSAGRACSHLPICFGEESYSVPYLHTIHTVHRYLAYITATCVIFIHVRTIKTRAFPFVPYALAMTLVLGQVGLGIGNVAYELNVLWIRLGHIAVAAGLFGAMVYGTACLMLPTRLKSE